jgi:HKD family nuclease
MVFFLSNIVRGKKAFFYGQDIPIQQKSQRENVLSFLTNNNLIEFRKRGINFSESEYNFTEEIIGYLLQEASNALAIRKYESSTKKETDRDQSNSQSNFDIVCTIPEISLNTVSGNDTILNTLGEITRILSQINERIFLSIPFVDEYGLKFLKDYCIQWLNKNVKIRILTRNDAKLKEKLESIGIPTAKMDIKSINANRGTLRPIVHSKVIIGDGKVAYIGSANFTITSLIHNLEVGAVIRGEKVKNLEKLIYSFWDDIE